MDQFDRTASPRQWKILDCRRPIGRSAYATIGALLMLVKYVVEMAAIKAYGTGQTYTLLDFLNPLLSARQKFLIGAPEWFGLAWIVWTLPFVAIAVTLTIRRAIAVGWSPWLGLAILVPFVNFVLMILLACVPSDSEANDAAAGVALRTEPPHASSLDASTALAAASGVGFSALYATIVALVCIYGFDSYGAALFFGVPLVAGAAAGFQYNLRQPREWTPTLLVGMLPMVCLGGVFLLFALEGLICIAMAAPIALPLSALGAAIGKNIASLHQANRASNRQFMGCLAALPLVAFGESRLP
jgi:uncharacterized membrane protein YhaH (DUF805 family)